MRDITITKIAEAAGCHRTTVQRAAHRLGLGQMIGVQLLFTADEAARIAAAVRPGAPGNPNIAEQSAAGVAARKKNKK